MFSKIFRNNCFEKHLRTIASIYNFKNLFNTLNASLSSYRNQSVRSALRNVAKFTRKNLCYFVATCLKKSQVHRCFPLNFLKFLRTPFLQNTSGRLFLDCLHYANSSYLTLKSSENLWLQKNHKKTRSYLIRLNLLNIRSEIWRRFLVLKKWSNQLLFWVKNVFISYSF